MDVAHAGGLYWISGGMDMADSKTRSKKGKIEDLVPFRLGEPNPDAAERAQEIKRRQKERGISFPDSTGMVRADRDSR
jgi:hypothetical protein